MDIPEFWRQSEVHKGFLTLFIRAGIIYYNDNFDAAFKAYDLANGILPAINHFLMGNTKVNNITLGHSGHLVNFFSNKSNTPMKHLSGGKGYNANVNAIFYQAIFG